MKSRYNWILLILAAIWLLATALGSSSDELTTSEYLDHYEGR